MSYPTTKNASRSSFECVHPYAAGIDVGSKEHFVAVPEERAVQSVRRFGVYTPCLHQMADWLEQCGVTTVAMESTGVYWIPVFEVLEDRGFEVYLVDGRQTKNVSGRKSDVQDCQWIQRLHSYGLLSAAFRPSRDIAAWRALSRQRAGIVESCSRQIHLMQKALEQMNVQLHKAVKDITGKTGMAIIQAILDGERDTVTLAKLRHPLVKKSEAEIAQALCGTYRGEHIFALRQACQAFHFFQSQLHACDLHIQEHTAQLTSKRPEAPAPAAPAPATYRRKSQPHFDLKSELIRITGADLTQIPGISQNTAQVLITECGIDMAAFRTEKHFTSWLGLCPNHRKTGGAIRSRRTRHVPSRAATSLRIAAQSLHRSKTALGAYYRRMRTRLGAPKAITATARKLACLIYRMLKHGQNYVEQGQDYYEKQYKKRILKNLAKTAKRLNLELINPNTGELVS